MADPLEPALPELTIRVIIQNQQARFQSLYLGTCDQLLPVMNSRFPELGMTRADCQEMTWLQSALYINSGSTSGCRFYWVDPVTHYSKLKVWYNNPLDRPIKF